MQRIAFGIFYCIPSRILKTIWKCDIIESRKAVEPLDKQTKNILSREWVEKELRFYNIADIRFSLILCGVLSLFLLPLTVGIVYAIRALIENILLKIVFSVLFAAITSAPIWINLFALHTALEERKLLRCGEFDIVTREVLYKSEKVVRRHTEEVLHFNDFKEISVEHTTFQLASQGDVFYIVHYKTKNFIKLLYPAKMYEYK